MQYNLLQEALRAQQLENIQQANIISQQGEAIKNQAANIDEQGEAIKNQAAIIDEQGEVISRLEEGLVTNKRESDCESEDMDTGIV